MPNANRLVKTFCDLVNIDSIAGYERQMADFIKLKLSDMGLESNEDNNRVKISGNAGNVTVKISGSLAVEPLLFMAHMDTVEPGRGKKPAINGDIIKSDGTTVLGGDDLAGVACILEAIAILKERKIPHGDIYAVFTIAEEVGLIGAKALDISKIPAKFAFIMDDEGPIGTVAVEAPYHNRLRFIVKGKAAHAGLNPEDGINAIQIASEAIANLPFMGRIDRHSTCNIGMISGGRASNVVPDEVNIEGEIRSIREEKLEEYSKRWISVFRDTVNKKGGMVDIEKERMYDGYSLSESHPILMLLKKAAERMNIPLQTHTTGGGSDTNIINTKGISAVDVSVGMTNVHSLDEQIAISDMEKACSLIIEIIKAQAEN